MKDKSIEQLAEELRETHALKEAYAQKVLRQKKKIQALKDEILRLHEQQLDVDWEIEADEAGLDKETQEEIIAMANATIKASDEHKEYVRNLEIENGILRNHLKELKAASLVSEDCEFVYVPTLLTSEYSACIWDKKLMTFVHQESIEKVPLNKVLSNEPEVQSTNEASLRRTACTSSNSIEQYGEIRFEATDHPNIVRAISPNGSVTQLYCLTEEEFNALQPTTK